MSSKHSRRAAPFFPCNQNVVLSLHHECTHARNHRRGLFRDKKTLGEETDMQRQVIEYAGLPVGIAIPEDNKLRFIAVKFHVIDLDNRRFSSIRDLTVAIRDHLAGPQAVAA